MLSCSCTGTARTTRLPRLDWTQGQPSRWLYLRNANIQQRVGKLFSHFAQSVWHPVCVILRLFPHMSDCSHISLFLWCFPGTGWTSWTIRTCWSWRTARTNWTNGEIFVEHLWMPNLSNLSASRKLSRAWFFAITDTLLRFPCLPPNRDLPEPRVWMENR